MARVLLFSLLLGTGVAISAVPFIRSATVSTNLLIYRLVTGIGMLALGLDVRRRGKQIDVQQGKVVFDYYMHVWKIFYFCYLFLPFIR
jgi:hypothetical protein